MSTYQSMVAEAERLLQETRQWQKVVRNSLPDEERKAKANRERCLERIRELVQQGDSMVGYQSNGRLQAISSTAHDIQSL